MSKDFLYCEETDTKIYSNDVVSISTYPNTKWIAKQGWYKLGSAQKNGWYFVSITDKTILPIDLVDIKDVVKDSNRAVSGEEHSSVSETTSEVTTPAEYLEVSDAKVFNNDIVIISSHPDTKYIAKYGWFTFDGEKQQGWYFLSVDDRSIIPLKDVELTEVTKDIIKIPISELRPTLKDIDTPNPVNDYLVIPGTNIRLYDGDIIKISTEPMLKWIVHLGWFIYQEVQNFGWYFESIKNGEILPASVIDLTLCTLVTAKTQGSETYDGKVVNYTRPFTAADAAILNRTFITLETIKQRDNLDKKKLVNGRLVRVNDVGGVPVYYSWNDENASWEKVDFGSASEARGNSSSAIGTGLIAKNAYQHVIGRFNIEDPGSSQPGDVGVYAEIVGNGSDYDSSHRSNARTLDWDGNEVLAGGLKVNGTKDVATVDELVKYFDLTANVQTADSGISPFSYYAQPTKTDANIHHILSVTVIDTKFNNPAIAVFYSVSGNTYKFMIYSARTGNVKIRVAYN